MAQDFSQYTPATGFSGFNYTNSQDQIKRQRAIADQLAAQAGLPHQIVLMFRNIWGSILGFIAWWIVLFTGNFPQSTHDFLRGSMLWSLRVSAYMGNMTDKYPPFSAEDDA